MLEKECKRLGYDTKILLKSDKLKDVSAQLRLENEENLMATIGYGGITLNSVMSKLVELYKKRAEADDNERPVAAAGRVEAAPF